MKTPPSDLPPIPLNHVYIGVDDGSLIEEGCDGAEGYALFNGVWRASFTREGGNDYSNLHVAAPTGSRKHMRNSVPDGFAYLGFVIRSSKEHSDDIVVWDRNEKEKWRLTPDFVAGSHYALRTGSPIALANGLVPPAPAPMHQATTEDVQESIRANFTKSATIETPKTVSDLEKWCAEWRDNIHRVNVQQIDTLKKRVVDMVAMPVPATSIRPPSPPVPKGYSKWVYRGKGWHDASFSHHKDSGQSEALLAPVATWCHPDLTWTVYLEGHPAYNIPLGHPDVYVLEAAKASTVGARMKESIPHQIQEVRDHLEKLILADMPVPVTSESAAARMLLDAFAEQVKTLKEEVRVLRDGRTLLQSTVTPLQEVIEAQKQEIASLARWKEEALQVSKKWDRIDAHVRRHPETTICDTSASKALEFLKERDAFKAELANLKAEIKNRGAGWDVAANLRDEVKESKAWGEVNRLEQELAHVRETLRTFYAAAEAMKAEVAK